MLGSPVNPTKNELPRRIANQLFRSYPRSKTNLSVHFHIHQLLPLAHAKSIQYSGRPRRYCWRRRRLSCLSHSILVVLLSMIVSTQTNNSNAASNYFSVSSSAILAGCTAVTIDNVYHRFAIVLHIHIHSTRTSLLRQIIQNLLWNHATASRLCTVQKHWNTYATLKTKGRKNL